MTNLTNNQKKILDRENIKTCGLDDPFYPPLLREIAKPPEFLYFQGNLPQAEEFTIGVVGTRKHTHYAIQVMERIIPALIHAGASIVSGLALGIDTLAHKIALKESSKTYGVLGGGIDKKIFYPHVNLSLGQAMVRTHGGVISEYPPGATPTRYTFPLRNRIIAGLSRAVLVIEAPEKSGALLTAYAALDEGRDVFAIPGDITRAESKGCNALIRRGAKPVVSPQDILEEYGFESEKNTKQGIPLDTIEASVVSLLTSAPKHIDELARESDLPVATISGALALLELKGAIRNVGAMRFVRS